MKTPRLLFFLYITGIPFTTDIIGIQFTPGPRSPTGDAGFTWPPDPELPAPGPPGPETPPPEPPELLPALPEAPPVSPLSPPSASAGIPPGCSAVWMVQ